VAEETRLVY